MKKTVTKKYHLTYSMMEFLEKLEITYDKNIRNVYITTTPKEPDPTRQQVFISFDLEEK